MTCYEFGCRAFQKIAAFGRMLWFWKNPKLLRGSGCAGELPALIKSLGLRRVLLVTDPGLVELGLPAPLIRGLEEEGIFCAVYGRTRANPSAEEIEAALRLYREEKCRAVIAFGGGSPMDCAKMAAYCAAPPARKPQRIRGIQAVPLRKPPKVFAVPTTAGTGSEVTIAAVVTDPRTHEKCSVLSPLLCPKYAALDPLLSVSLPPDLTGQTGMDALTHAVEAYISRGSTKKTDAWALQAVKLIFANLETAYADGGDVAARDAMLYAAYCAGAAFTRAYVGYAHSIAHALGGLYDLPHGLSCAVALPTVLAAYGEAAHARLADLYDAADLPASSQSNAEKAAGFIAAIRQMNARMQIPEGFDCIKAEDIPQIAARAVKEGNPLYPVPKIMRRPACEDVIRSLMRDDDRL